MPSSFATLIFKPNIYDIRGKNDCTGTGYFECEGARHKTNKIIYSVVDTC